MIIYIRHGHDKDSSKYKQDAKLTKYGKKMAKIRTKHLIDMFGFPDKILYSPFQRCKKTAVIMTVETLLIKTGSKKHVCDRCIDDRDIELIADPNLSRYFTKSEKKHKSVKSSTLKSNVPIYESKNDFIKRIKEHAKTIIKSDGIVWCITHAYIYKKIANELNVPVSNHIDFLDFFIYEH
jgi:broad specificity phosphatase PhoE